MATSKDKAQRDYRLVAGAADKTSLDFNKMRIDQAVYRNDVVIDAAAYKTKTGRRKIKKEDVEKALAAQDLRKLREFSNYWFITSGIYSRLCRYIAYLYRYDWFITPIRYDDKISDEKVVEGWFKAAAFLDNCRLKKNLGEIALKVVRNGCYYGYKIGQKTSAYLQELPVDYCRSRYRLNGRHIVEFNVKFFDERFTDVGYRTRVLKMFPPEFRKGYVKFKKGTLSKDYQGDDNGWIALDPEKTIKFNLNNTDIPLFVAIIPKLIDLEEAQDLDKEKMKQQLLRLIIQKMPIDKNGDLIFDVEEARELHKNAVAMLGSAIGIDVLTTFADVDVADLSDKSNMSAADQLNKVERTVYNEAGVSQMQFNTDGNIALEKSIANDEATMTDLLLQFEEFIEDLLKPFNKNPKRLQYTVQMLPTTIYNYRDLSKIYKEQTQIGFSKLLPQVALGQQQSTIIATAIFENQMLNLDELFVPPQMSSTMSPKETEASGGAVGGRPALPDDEKSEKTIRNIEAGS